MAHPLHALNSSTFRLVEKTRYEWLVMSGSETVATISQYYNNWRYEERSWRLRVNVEGAKSTKHFNPQTAFDWIVKNWEPARTA